MIDSKTFWDKIAPKYAQSPIRNEAAYEATLTRIGAYLRPNMRVLELGCGTGTTALRLAPQVARITGVDHAPGMITIARGRAAEAGADTVDFTVAGVNDTGPGPYDAVLAFNLLHLLDDMDGSLAHIHGLLPPGGLFISKTVCLAEPGQGILRFVVPVVLPVLQMLGKAPYFRRLRIAELQGAITRAGFESVETDNLPARPPSHFVVARRV